MTQNQNETQHLDPAAFIKNLAEKLSVNESDVRIKYGVSNRVVYGKLGKDFRNELDDTKLAVMGEAMQQPSNANLKQYRNNKPCLEITVKDKTVFRQEKNGAITVNQVQLERETAPVSSTSTMQQQTAQQKPSTTSQKKLKFADLQKEAEAAGLKLKRYKTNGYIVFVGETSNCVHESDRLTRLTEVQTCIQQYREQQAAPTTQAQSQVEEMQEPQSVPVEQPEEVQQLEATAAVSESEIVPKEAAAEIVESAPEMAAEPEMVVSPDLSYEQVSYEQAEAANTGTEPEAIYENFTTVELSNSAIEAQSLATPQLIDGTVPSVAETAELESEQSLAERTTATLLSEGVPPNLAPATAEILAREIETGELNRTTEEQEVVTEAWSYSVGQPHPKAAVLGGLGTEEVIENPESEMETQALEPELEVEAVLTEDPAFAELAETEVTVVNPELEPMIEDAEISNLEPTVLEESEVIIEIPDSPKEASRFAPTKETKLQSLLEEIQGEINLNPTTLPSPQTPEQIRTFLESEAKFWKESGLDVAADKGELATNYAAKLEDFGVETDERYRSNLEMANSEWILKYQSDLQQNCEAGLEQIESGAAGNNLVNVLENLTLPSTFVEAAKQIQQLPADHVRDLLTDWVSTVSKDAFVAVNQGTTLAKNFGDRFTDLFKNLQHLATDFSQKADTLSEKATDRVEAIKAWQAEQTVAQTALRVYKHHHERMFKDPEYREQHQDEFNTFKGQKYTITQKGKNFYELSSTETQQVLMQFKETFWKLEVKENSKKLQPQDYQEFAQIKEKLNRLGLEQVQGIGQNHYGGMKPEKPSRQREGMALN